MFALGSTIYRTTAAFSTYSTYSQQFSPQVLRMSLIRVSASLTLATPNDPLVVTSDTLVMADAPARQSLAVHLSAMLDAGHYVIVPEMGADGGAEPYVLKLWCPMDFTACLLN